MQRNGGFTSKPRELFHFRVYCRFNHLNSVSGIELQFSCYFNAFAVQESKKLILTYVVMQRFAFRVCMRDRVHDFNASQITSDRWGQSELQALNENPFGSHHGIVIHLASTA